MILRYPRRGPIPTAQRKTVSHIMLEARSNTFVVGYIRPFQPSDECDAHHLCQIWVFAEGFPEPWPKRLAADIKYGRKAPRDGGRARFDRRDLSCPLHQRWVP